MKDDQAAVVLAKRGVQVGQGLEEKAHPMMPNPATAVGV